ncbi:hypothetical protein CXG81DRAFT_11167 [Caulochytrium protostelioides]|uniref:DNA polymerase delta small subunit n=1 Tax=Caulochytrium protostelioides TaxID=1555241 RepID=A0A4P9X9V8_9FUNG|nr:hypothetical protein CXG81DRAFT_11167 [Caulochytrium protostelioides]|eukprot:RKP02143.1 hypothetical protein CXG81DRAFT_11167 [Caulochytrium protostelioides]
MPCHAEYHDHGFASRSLRFLTPSSAEDDAAAPIERVQVSCTDECDRYRIRNRSYQQQYAGLYYSRLKLMRNRCHAAAQRQWPQIPHVPRLLNVEVARTCFLIGTFFIDMPLKTNILDEVTQDQWLELPPPRDKIFSDKDEYKLEDESGRVVLVGDILESHTLVSGVIAAFLGHELPSGEFHVDDICFATPGPCLPLPPAAGPDAPKRYVALVSGIELGAPNSLAPELDLLVDYLCGELGGPTDAPASLVRVIVAGNTLTTSAWVALSTEEKEMAALMVRRREKEEERAADGVSTAPSAAGPVPVLETADDLLFQLASTVDVDVLPGALDPATHTMPQQPLHRGLFPRAGALSTFHPTTNPYAAVVGGRRLLGTSGQPVDDIFHYLDSDDRLAMLERTYRWKHVAPTAPDTLWSYPFPDSDPFTIDATPDLYFAGNQPAFATTTIPASPDADGPPEHPSLAGRSVRLVLVPSFRKTRQFVRIDLDTMDCDVISISTHL